MGGLTNMATMDNLFMIAQNFKKSSSLKALVQIELGDNCIVFYALRTLIMDFTVAN